MRMALVEGWHRALPVEQLGEKMVERCSNIWWTVYILDRRFASLIGSPNSVNDEDMTAMLWDLQSCSQEAASLSLHVKISQVITRVVNSQYSLSLYASPANCSQPYTAWMANWEVSSSEKCDLSFMK